MHRGHVLPIHGRGAQLTEIPPLRRPFPRFDSSDAATGADMRTAVVVALIFASWSAHATPATCRTGGDGRVACGYHCRVGGDGVAVCADTDDGVCGVGGDGRVVCTHLAWMNDDDHRSARERAECRVGGNGRVACGFQCRVGGDGVAVCARGPGGACRTGGDGRVACFDGPFAQRGRGRHHGEQHDNTQQSITPASCITGGDGRVACGYACRVGGDGKAACADRADGACGVGGNGRVVCTSTQ